MIKVKTFKGGCDWITSQPLSLSFDLESNHRLKNLKTYRSQIPDLHGQGFAAKNLFCSELSFGRHFNANFYVYTIHTVNI